MAPGTNIPIEAAKTGNRSPCLHACARKLLSEDIHVLEQNVNCLKMDKRFELLNLPLFAVSDAGVPAGPVLAEVSRGTTGILSRPNGLGGGLEKVYWASESNGTV